MNQVYCVKYLENGMFSKEKFEIVLAPNKQEAYSKFLKDFGYVYAAWVDNVTYQNGNVHVFNTFPGKPY